MRISIKLWRGCHTNDVWQPHCSFDILLQKTTLTNLVSEETAGTICKRNLYWDCYNGFNFKNPEKENELSATFEDVEQLFYRQRYRDFVTGQNERNVKNRHPERNKETGDLLKSKKTCPEETVYQIGTLDNHVPPELLIEIVTEFMEIVNERFGSHVHILNWALHLDESTPHIHERHVFDCENQYGEIAPQQEKALEALGFELPEPEKPVGRKNNRKMTFDSACRVLLFDVAKKHGLQLEEEPEYGGRAYLEKQDYILFKQKEQLAAQEQKLEELTMKIEDVEALVDEVADIAYDKAVEVVADTVKLETHKEDIKLVEQSKAWVLSPERKASKKEIEYATKRLDGVIARITNAMSIYLRTFFSAVRSGRRVSSRLLNSALLDCSAETSASNAEKSTVVLPFSFIRVRTALLKASSSSLYWAA